MIRHIPDKSLNGISCSVVAVSCAKGVNMLNIPQFKNKSYATLSEANKYIRENLEVKKRVNYKRGQRPKLKDLHLNERAIVCVYGHFLYLDHEDYWSFCDNENDTALSAWIIN